MIRFALTEEEQELVMGVTISYHGMVLWIGVVEYIYICNCVVVSPNTDYLSLIFYVDLSYVHRILISSQLIFTDF